VVVLATGAAFAVFAPTRGVAARTRSLAVLAFGLAALRTGTRAALRAAGRCAGADRARAAVRAPDCRGAAFGFFFFVFATAFPARDAAVDLDARDLGVGFAARDFAVGFAARDFAVDFAARDFAVGFAARDVALAFARRDFALSRAALGPLRLRAAALCFALAMTLLPSRSARKGGGPAVFGPTFDSVS
jgi:hypothetical protein